MSAKQIEADGESIVLIFVPERVLLKIHPIQIPLVLELEKKLSKSLVVFLAQRKILPVRGKNQKPPSKSRRPYKNTLTYVHEAILNDILYPVEVIGRRIRVKTNGKKYYKYYLDLKDRQNVEGRLNMYAAVYRKLTGKNITFLFSEIKRITKSKSK